MDKIIIRNLEIFCRVGVPDLERERPQRLLINIEMAHDFAAAAGSDDLAETIDYHAVCQRLLRLGEVRSWKLIEKLASDIAQVILAEFKPRSVRVEVKKFVIPEAQYISVIVERSRGEP